MPLLATETSSPMTPAGTSVRAIAPVAGFSTTSAPAAVTATIPGGRTALVAAEAVADAEAAVLAVAEALAPAPAAWLPELPQPASRATAAVAAASTLIAGMWTAGISGSIGKLGWLLAAGGACGRQPAFEHEVGADPDSTGRARQELPAN